MLERHSTQECERDLETETPRRMSLLELASSEHHEKTELEPYWDFEHAPQPRPKESTKDDALSEQKVAVWVAILFLIGVSVLFAYFFWIRLANL